ncbi:MAG: 4'-phosphopantetheinyl transferase superfamily protein [Myxococcaceae bacterium]
MSTGLTIAFTLPLLDGLCVGVELPDEIPESTSGIHPEEWRLSVGYGDLRRRTWLGGRVALREALRRIGGPSDLPLLPNARGAPILPRGFVGSVSHKARLAVALVTPDRGARIGVDVEELETRPRLHLAGRILTPREREALEQLPPNEQWHELLLRFSAKEALYKAIDPYVQRYVGFLEVAIERRTEAQLGVTELAEADLQRLTAHGEWRELQGHLLTAFCASEQPPHAT